MQPNKRTVHEFIFRTDGYFQIPDFQRPYTWEGYQIDTFLEDIEKVANSKKKHYFGTIVYIKDGDHSSIIDGQQRLTTSLLLIVAIYHILQEYPEKSNNYNAELIKSQYLLNTYSANAHNRNKITLRTVTTDNTVFEKIFNNNNFTEKDKANKLFKAYSKFKTFLSNTQNNIDVYIDSLKNFEIVEIILDNNDDNPQLIFENINSTGKPLSSGDKIRNWALMLNNEDVRIFIYDNYWKKIEEDLTRVEKNKQIDYITDFFRMYLMCKENEFISDSDTYKEFKNILQEKIKDGDSIKDNLKAFYDEIILYLRPYLAFKFAENIPELDVYKEQMFSLNYLQTDIINSFVIQLFVDYMDKKLTKDEVINSLEILETYLVRKMICGLNFEGLNNRFPEYHKKIRKIQEANNKKTFDDCFAFLLLNASGRTNSFPTDAEIENAIRSLDFYNSKKWQQEFILAKICDQSKDSSLLHQIKDKHIKLSVEHIMPQTISNSDKWKRELGDNYEQIHSKWLHSLANLTLTGYNSEYSNKSFSDKKTLKDIGFNDSPLKINQHIATYDSWNEASLELRTKWLLEQIKNIWSYPTTTLPLSNQQQISDEDTIYTPYSWEVTKRTKPIIMFINKEENTVSKWIDVYKKTIVYIYDNFSDKFMRLIDNSNEFGIAKRPLITMDKNIPNKSDEITHGIFIERNMNVPAIMSNIKKICEFVGYSEKNCPVSFTLETNVRDAAE